MKSFNESVKKIIFLVLIVSLFVPINLRVNGADEILTEGNFRYKVVEEYIGGPKVASIYGYTGGNSKIVIPETLGEYRVVYVNSLDGSKKAIDSILLSKNVKSVNDNLEKIDSRYETRLIEIEKYEVVNENPYLSVKDGVLFNKKQTILYNYPRGKKDEEYTEPSTVEESYGANSNSYVKKWTLSSNKKNRVTTDYAYNGCSNLEEVTIPKNILVIGNYSFANCNKLKKINWHDGVERIWDCAFYKCNSLASVKFPGNLLSIAGAAFENCNLSSIKLPNRLNYIGSYAFTGNSQLKKVKIPDSVTKFSKDAFDMKTTKVIMPAYMKKQTIHFNNYIAKATVTTKGKTKNYNAIYITKIKAKKKKVTVKKGGARKLNTKVYIYNKNTKLKKNGILKTNILQFSSSNKKVAKVTSSGKVKALKKGTTVITVTLRTAKENYKAKWGNPVEKVTKKIYKVKVTVK